MECNSSLKVTPEIKYTNYFIYGNQRFGINSTIFSQVSSYFRNNFLDLSKNVDIPLIDHNDEEVYTLDDKVINIFINICHKSTS